MCLGPRAGSPSAENAAVQITIYAFLCPTLGSTTNFQVHDTKMDVSSNNPTLKRRRTEADRAEFDATGFPDDAVERSDQFWFDDGNVVLQAEATQFRVHRSILSHHSSVMKDCFQCPQPRDAPTIEGCPLVHLQDSAKDIGNMCSLLYGMYLCVRFARPSNLKVYFRVLASISRRSLRLSWCQCCSWAGNTKLRPSTPRQ